MKKYYLFLFAVVVITCSVSAFSADAGITVTKNIVFGKAGSYVLYGDMYVPEGSGPFPGILFIHGGGFITGDKLRSSQVPFYHLVAQEGYTVFSINYRLIQDGGTFPDCIKDVKTGLAWMIAHRDVYKIDSDRIGVIGMSAGAYLAAMIAFTPNDARFQPDDKALKDSDTSVDAAVLFYPPMNFNTFNSSIATIFKLQLKKKTGISSHKKFAEYLKFYSPINYVKKEPPIFLSFSEPDGIVENSQQYEFMDRMKEAGTVFERVAVSGEGIGHGFVISKPDSPQSIEVRKRMFAFLEKYVKSED